MTGSEGASVLRNNKRNAVAGAFAPRPVIDAGHSDRAVGGANYCIPIQSAQDRRVAERHTEPPHQTLRGPSAHAMINEADDFRQACGLAGERCRKTRKSLGKDAPNAPHVSAPPAR